MRIAVVQPPVRDFYLTPHRMSGLGAETVLGLSRGAGYEAQLFNFPLTGGSARLPVPAEAEYLKAFLLPAEIGPTSFFTSFKHYGPTFLRCAEAVAAFRPDAVFVSSFAFAYAEEALALGRALRKALPGVPLVVGGGGTERCFGALPRPSGRSDLRPRGRGRGRGRAPRKSSGGFPPGLRAGTKAGYSARRGSPRPMISPRFSRSRRKPKRNSASPCP